MDDAPSLSLSLFREREGERGSVCARVRSGRAGGRGGARGDGKEGGGQREREREKWRESARAREREIASERARTRQRQHVLFGLVFRAYTRTINRDLLLKLGLFALNLSS